MPAELFANPPTPGGTTPWGLASLATSVGTTPAPGTVETWTLNQTPTGLSAQAGRFRFVIDNEICIDVTGAPGTSRQVWRGAEGSTPATHAIGALLYHTITAQALAPLGETFHAVSYGVKADGATVADAAITSGQATLSSSSAAFTSADVGKLAVVVGAGTPISTTTTGALTSGVGVTSLAVNALGSAIPPGGVIISSGANSQAFNMSGALAGATSIPLIGPVVGGLTSALSTGAAITSLPVAALNFALPSGTVTLIYLSNTEVLNTQTFTTTGAAVGATSIPVTSQTPNFAYPESATVFGNPTSVNANFSYPSGSAVKTNVPALSTTISSVTGGVATLAANAGTTVSGAECFYATDDTAALTACKVAAEAVNGTVVLPEGDIGYSGALVSSVPITIQGQGVKELYGGLTAQNDSNWPSVSPYLKGTVLVQCALNRDAIQLTAQGRSQHVSKLGIRFAGKFQNTGNGIYNVSASAMGNIGGVFDDVRVFGVDGSHYGLVSDSPELCRVTGYRSYGGGGLWLKTNATLPGPPGNTTYTDCYFSTFIAGFAQAILLDATGLVTLGMDSLTFTNVEANVRIPNPVIANTTPPQNGGSQSPLQTLNAVKVLVTMWDSPGFEADPTGTFVTWPSGVGSNRTNDPNYTHTTQALPTSSPANATNYQLLSGKTMLVLQEFLLTPAAAATASTTTTGALSSGATSIPLTSSTGFSAGQGVQIDTGVNMEFAIVATVPDGTHITVTVPGSFGLEIPHSSGVNVSAGAAVVYAQISASSTMNDTTVLGKRVSRWGSAIGTAAHHVSFNFPLPTSWYYRLNWANAARMWTDFTATFG